MERIIYNMMTWFNVTESRLKEEKEIPTPIRKTLYWDYYCYVKEHPIVDWNNPTSVLYDLKNNLCEFEIVSEFVDTYEISKNLVREEYLHIRDFSNLILKLSMSNYSILNSQFPFNSN